MQTLYTIMRVYFLIVKAPNKKAEKNKKSALKTPNSSSEAEAQYSSGKEGK